MDAFSEGQSLCPNISPKKTVEGVVGGVAAGVALAVFFASFLLPSVNWLFLVVISALLVGVGIVGDLTESVMKRGTNTKDSGSILAGHGGVLDRMDSILFAGPFLYYADPGWSLMKRIALLGATGSIGLNVLNVIRAFPQLYCIVGLAAGRNIALLKSLILEFRPQLVSVLDAGHAERLCSALPEQWRTRVVWGESGNELVASLPDADMTISAIVGAAGLIPTLAAINAGKDIGLANKETLVMAGRLVMDAVRKNGVRMLPVDSEHSAIFQTLEGGRKEDLEKIILTASGGPFRERTLAELEQAVPEQALAHPNWSMGRKISIDSATLMNKGLEVIEAKWLFDVPLEMIEVVVHPQSIVHSLVEFHDGSVLAQLGIPDMRIPIAYALSYPERLSLGLEKLRLSQCRNLQFYEPDHEKFPALKLAFEAIRQGGVMPAVLNGANEVAVEAFLDARIGFTSIVHVVALTMERIDNPREDSLDNILAADLNARIEAGKIVNELSLRS